MDARGHRPGDRPNGPGKIVVGLPKTRSERPKIAVQQKSQGEETVKGFSRDCDGRIKFDFTVGLKSRDCYIPTRRSRENNVAINQN